MVRQPFDLVGEAVGIEPFDGLHNARVQRSAPLLQEAAVGHLVRQGVLEGVGQSGNRQCLVEEFGGLQARETLMQRLLGHVGNGLQQGPGHLGADDCGGLEQALVLRWQAVDAGRQHRLHRGRHLDCQQRLRQMIGPRRADQHPGFHQGADALLQKEGIAAGAGDQEGCERRQTGVVPQEGLQKFLGTRGGERVEAQLRVVGLAAPAVLVLGAVIDQEQEPRRRQALDQAIEQRLRLGIDPVQILKDQQQRLHLAFPDQQALERVQGAPAALRRVERQEGWSSGRTSSSHSRAGTVSWRASSSVSTCPVTLARMVRVSSRSSTWA